MSRLHNGQQSTLLGRFPMQELTFKYIWTILLSPEKVRETKTSNDNNSNNITTTATSNVCISCVPTTIFVQFCNLLYIMLMVEIFQNSCINPNMVKSLIKLFSISQVRQIAHIKHLVAHQIQQILECQINQLQDLVRHYLCQFHPQESHYQAGLELHLWTHLGFQHNLLRFGVHIHILIDIRSDTSRKFTMGFFLDTYLHSVDSIEAHGMWKMH